MIQTDHRSLDRLSLSQASWTSRRSASMNDKKREEAHATHELCTRLKVDFGNTGEAADHGSSEPSLHSIPEAQGSPTDLSLFSGNKKWLLQPILTAWEQDMLNAGPAWDGYSGGALREPRLDASSSSPNFGEIKSSGLGPSSDQPIKQRFAGTEDRTAYFPQSQPVWPELPKDTGEGVLIDHSQTRASTSFSQVYGAGPQASRSLQSPSHSETHGNVNTSRSSISSSVPLDRPLSFSEATVHGEKRQMGESDSDTSSPGVSRQDHTYKYWIRGPGACSRCSKAKTRCEESQWDRSICARCEKREWTDCNMIARRRSGNRVLRP